MKISALSLAASLLAAMPLLAAEDIDLFGGTGFAEEIFHNDTTPRLADGTDFGTVNVTGGSVSNSFRIRNDGDEELFLYSGATGSSHFTITGLTVSPLDGLAPGETETFTITFNPTTAGTFLTDVTIVNSDSGENPFTFRITGTGIGFPEIEVSGENNIIGGYNDIPNGKTAIDQTDSTYFRPTSVGDDTTNHFRITNTGDGNLAVSIIDNSGHFYSSVVSQGIAPGNTLALDITFDPTTYGVHTATIIIDTNDADEDPFTFNVRGTAVAPDIFVQGGPSQNVTILDGDTTPSTADGTNFGSVDLFSDSTTKQFTIRNESDATQDLNVFSVSVTGTHAGDFTVSAAPAPGGTPETVPIGGGDPFFITFDPSGTGVRSATVVIQNTDPEETPYTFNIIGTGAVTPEISLTGSPGGGLPQSTINNSSNIAITTNGTDFGNVVVGQSESNTFVVSNTGSAALTLSASSSDPQFQVSGLASTVNAGSPGNDFFTITFTPSGDGPQSAIITLDTNDPDNDPFTFLVAGDGIAPEIDLRGDDGTNPVEIILSGDTTPRSADGTDFGSVALTGGSETSTFRIYNRGSSLLTIIAASLGDDTNFSLAGIPAPPSNTIPPNDAFLDFTITYDPATAGIHTTTVTLVNDDPDEGIYTFTITGEATADSAVRVAGRQNSSIPYLYLVNGVATPSAPHGTDFPETELGDTSATQFQILNEGDATLTYSMSSDNPRFTFGGVDADGEIEPGEGADFFQIIFEPDTLGVETATITIDTNDPDDDPFTFLVRGTGVGPEIAVSGILDIADGDDTPSAADGTDYGNTDINSESITRSFTIANLGDRDLLITLVDLIGDTSDFTIISAPAAATTILPGASEDIEVRFDPTATGTRTATLRIISNDDDETLFDFDIGGFGVDGTTDPDIAIYGGMFLDTLIASGDSKPSTLDGTDFGTAVEGGSPVSVAFKISNEGGQTLNLGRPGSSSPEVEIISPSRGSIGAGSSITVTVNFDPTTPGTQDAILSFPSDDPNESPYVFLVRLEVEPSDPEPADFVSLDLDAGDGTATFRGVDGVTYILTSSTTLEGGSWDPVPGTSPITADGTEQSFEFSYDIATDPRRFYRIEVQP